MSTGFDLPKIKEQLQGQLENLSEKEIKILADLEAVRKEKEEIEEFLRIKKPTKSKRNRYRPKVVEYFEEGDTSEASITADAQMLLDELFDGDEDLMAGLKISMARLGREDENYTYNSASSSLTYFVPTK